MIATRCPQCRKCYHLAESAVGRTARCRCGASWKVQADPAADAPSAVTSQGNPAAADGGMRDLSWEDEIAGVFSQGDGDMPTRSRRPARESAPTPVGGEMSRPTLVRGGTPASTESADAATPIAPPVQTGASFDAQLAQARIQSALRRVPDELARRRPLVAGLCQVYGALMILVILGIWDWTGLFWVCIGAFVIALAVGVVASGAMLRRGDDLAHAWAGLACLALCFVPAWGHVRSMLALATAGEFLHLALRAALFAVTFAVPCYVTYWALRYEQARQALEEESKL